MKILIVFNHPAPYKVRFFNMLGKHINLHVIFERQKASDRHPLFYDQKVTNFTIHPIKGINLGSENHYSHDVIKHLKNNEYDLIIMNGYSTFTEMKTINYLKRKKIPYCFYANGGIVKKECFLKYIFKKHFISGASAYFSSSHETSRYLEHYGAPKDKIFRYSYSTIFDDEILKNILPKNVKRNFYKKHNIEGANIFVSATSFIKRKNNMFLLKTWKNMNTADHLVLIGSGKEKTKLERFINKNNLNNVHILSFVPRNEILSFLAHADYGIYLSRYDIYGHVINESLSQGLSIIASYNMNATKELIKHGKNGLIYKNSDDLPTLIANLKECDFTKEALKTAKENTIEVMVIQHLKIFKELI